MTGLGFGTTSDTVAGYVTGSDKAGVTLRTSNGVEVRVLFTDTMNASIMRNFDEPYRDVTGQLADLLVDGRYVYVYGVRYPEEGGTFEAKQIVLPEEIDGSYVFEHVDWWVSQARAVADFYLRGQFPDGDYDWRNYRTKLTLSGTHTPDYVSPDFRQETDTISRLVYGLATAYLLTGEDRFLEAAESGTEYLRQHMRVNDDRDGVVYWYHGIDISATGQRKIYASEFGDDYDAIPAYEQIYALAGPTQTMRITGDPLILADIDRTMALFRRFLHDEERGGYFSHLDPVTLDPRSATLGHNRARKNWNSVGDHAPAYLINAVLATGRKDLADFLATTADTIVERFPDYDNSPFVQERFHEDWSPDRSWGWQQNRAVVGHNLKIAWNLMRINNLHPDERYVELARKIAGIMPGVGSDQQRGGWYDVVERTLAPGQTVHRMAWHDRKAWWQQEQAILAYLVLAGTLHEPEYLRHGREAASFYNAFFLDHDDGGIFFNVLATGVPYLQGTERLKGSHSMSGYHSMELCYLAAVYTGLLVAEEPLELHFKPKPGALPDRVLRVAPDLLPADRVRLTDVWVDGKPYADFDPVALTVTLPEASRDLRVKVRVSPASLRFDARVETDGKAVKVVCRGALEPDQVARFRRVIDQALADQPSWVELDLTAVTDICRPAVNEMLLVRAKMDIDESLVITGASEQIADTLRETDAFVLDAVGSAR